MCKDAERAKKNCKTIDSLASVMTQKDQLGLESKLWMHVCMKNPFKGEGMKENRGGSKMTKRKVWKRE